MPIFQSSDLAAKSPFLGQIPPEGPCKRGLRGIDARFCQVSIFRARQPPLYNFRSCRSAIDPLNIGVSEAYPFKPFAGRAEKRRVFIPRYLAGLRKMGRKPGKKTRIFGFSMKSLYVLLGNTAILNVCFFSYVQWDALICVDENFGPGRRSRFSFLGGLEADFGPSSDFGDRQSSHLPSGY